MAENSKIAWTHHTFNPWIGCTKVGPGCDACYAEAWDARFGKGVATHWGPKAPRRRTTEQNWNKVLRWQKDAQAQGVRLRVFCASLADVFDNEASRLWRHDLWQLMGDCPNLDWILVTKRVGNIPKMAPSLGFAPNVIVVSTIVNQAEADRDLDKLVMFKRDGVMSNIGVSYEPALGPVDWSRWLDHLDWIIVGGESDQGEARARPFHIGWARSTIDQCRTAGVAVFVKQLGDTVVFGTAEVRDRFAAKAGADPVDWPVDLNVRKFPVLVGAA